jgi:superfamily I DNA/RNA helicase
MSASKSSSLAQMLKKRDSDSERKIAKAFSERADSVNAVLASKSRKKVVVAGPGTGKTHLFKKILKGKQKTLTLTFVNSLVEDLALELCGLSEVKTLHAYARSALGRAKKGVKVFPKLSLVIKEDAKILLDEAVDFDFLFHNREDENPHIAFYKKRKNYYDHYGFSDIVFAIVKYFENANDKIPTYEQVLVDEFQDFNKLEVSLIDLLAEKSPVLLAGDDDQALYDFKSASTKHIRQRHDDKNFGYEAFNLPYCSRCTRVIVETANDIINKAKENGYLKGRIKKPYQYFEAERKNQESDQNPKIIVAKVFAKQIPWFIEQRLAEIAEEVKGKFSVLIISPYKVQSRQIVDALKGNGLENVETAEEKGDKELTLFDGLKVLFEDKQSNLGWRIVSKILLPDAEFESLLKKSHEDGTIRMVDLVDGVLKQEVKGMLKILQAIKKDEETEQEEEAFDEAEFAKILRRIGFDPFEITKEYLKDKIESGSRPISNPSIRNIRIKATTIQSAKGLADEYVFITHFDDRFFIKDEDKTKISDQEICNFLVALTRAKRKVFLVSSDKNNEPTFLKWINKARIEVFENLDQGVA